MATNRAADLKPKSMVGTTKKFNIRNYMRNATKSVTYIATSTIGTMSPALKDLAEVNADFTKDLIRNVKDIKKNTRSGMDRVANDAYTQVAADFVRNTISDFKSGKWYNKEREDQASSDMFGFDFDDWDMDFDTDFGAEEGTSGIGDNDKFIAGQIDNVGSKIAQASSKATIESAQYIAQANNATTMALMAQNEQLIGRVTNSIVTVNTTIASVGMSIIDPLNTHIANSTKFYESTTKLLQDQNQILSGMNTILNDRFVPKKKPGHRKEEKDYGSATYGDMVDIKGYLDIVKSNIKDMTDMYTSLLGMADMGGKRGSGLKAMTASPIAMMVSMAAQTISEKVLGDSMDRFNKTLQGFFGSLIMKLNQRQNDSGITGILARVFGIKSTLKKDIDTSRYEKGRVDFDGITRKSIVEVIPTQLSKIVAVLTGEPEQRYDYNAGKFVTMRDIKKKRTDMDRRYSNQASSDIQSSFRNYASQNIAFGTRQEQEKFYEQMERFFESLYTGNKMYDYNRYNSRNASSMAKEYGDIDPQVLRMITEFYKANARNNRGHLNLGINGNIMSSRAAQTRQMQQEEESGNSLFAHLYNNSGTVNRKRNNLGMLGVEDDKGNNIFFYLQSFYKDLKKIAAASKGKGGGPNGGRGRGGRGGSYDVPDNRSRNNPRTQEQIDDEEYQRRLDQIFESSRNSNQNRASLSSLSSLSSEEIQERLRTNTGFRSIRELNQEKRQRYQQLYQTAIENGLTEEQASEFASAQSGYTPRSGTLGQDLRNANTLGAKFGAIKSHITSKLNPSAAASKILDSVDNHLYRMIYGNEDDPESGNSIIGKLFNKIDQGFDDFFLAMKNKASDFFKNVLGVDKILDKILGEKDEHGKRSGGMIAPFLDAVKQNFRGVGKWIKGAVSETGNAIVQPFREASSGGTGHIGGAFTGGVVRRTGVAAVSEGEIIIPSRYNPFYRGTNNTSVQKSRENLAKGRYLRGGSSRIPYFGNFAEGTESVGGDPKNDKYKFIKDFAFASAKEFFGGIMAVKDRLFGNPKSDNEAFNDTLKDTMQNMKKYAPDLATGALIGGGVSLVGGLIGGPLLGAAAGSAVALTMKSEKVQKLLFGDIDEEGNRTGGVFSSKLSNFITKKLPGLSKFATTGALAAMIPGIPGGPITGLILGSALGVATQSESFKDFIFGNEEKGIQGKIDPQKMKKLLPKMGAGAIAGIIGGPFGLAGNIMMGAAIGYASDTDKFKEAVFGVKDDDGNYHGGILGALKNQVVDPLKNYMKNTGKKANDWLKEKVFKPIEDAVQPLGKLLQMMVGGAGKALQTQFKNHVTAPLGKKLEDWILKPARGIIGNTLGKMVLPAIKIAATPLRAIGAAGKAARKYEIRKGTADFMTAQERIDYRNNFRNGMERDFEEGHKGNASLKLDQALVGMSQEELAELGSIMKENRKKFGRNKEGYDEASKEFSRAIAVADLNADDSKWIAKWANKGDTDTIAEKIKDIDYLPEEKKQKLMESLDIFKSSTSANDSLNSLLNENQQKLFGKLKIDVNDKNYGKIQNLIETEEKARIKQKKQEQKRRDALSPEEKSAEDTEKIEEHVTTIQEEVQKVNENLDKLIRQNNGETVESENSTESAISKFSNTPSGNDAFKEAYQSFLQAGFDPETAEKFAKETSGGDSNGKTIEEHITADGQVLQYIRDSKNGTMELNTSDSETKEYQSERDQEKKDRKNMTESLGKLSLLDRLLGNDEDEEEEDKDKEPGFLSKLFGKVAMFFAPVVSVFKNFGAFLVKAIGTALSSVLPVVLAGLGLKALVDGTATELAHNAEDTVLGRTEEDRENYELTYSTDTMGAGLARNMFVKGQNYSGVVEKIPFVGKMPVVGKTLKLMAKAGEKTRDLAKKGIKTMGGAIAKTGAAQTIKEKTSSTLAKAGTKLANSKLAKTGVGSFIKNKATKFMENKGTQTAVNEALESLLATGMDADQAMRMAQETVGVSAEQLGRNAAEQGAKNTLTQAIKGKLADFVGKIAKFLPDGMADVIVNKLGPQIAEETAQKGGAKALKNAGEVLAKLGPIALVIAAWDFSEGFQDARSILGIVDKPTVLQRVMSGLVKSLYGLIPFIGGLFPTEWLVNVIMFVFEKVPGLKEMVAGLKQQREQAKQIVDEYNKANNSHLTIRDYCKNVLDDKTIGNKIAETAGKAAKGIKGAWNKFWGKDEVEEEQTQTTVTYDANDPLYKDTSDASKVVENKSYDKKINEALTTLEDTGTVADPTIAVDLGAASGIPSASRVVNNKVGGKSGGYDIKATDEYTAKLLGYATNGKPLSTFDKEKQPQTDNTLMGRLNQSALNLTKNMVAPFITLIRSFDMVGGVLGNMFGSISGENTNSSSGGVISSISNTVSSGISKGWNALKTGVKNAGSFVKNLFTGGSSFISQRDPRYAYRRFGKNTTIGEYGCGPAAAAMAINQARGANVSLEDAANYAASKGYVAGSSGMGTRSDYFGDIFSRYGLGSRYTNSTRDIKKSVASGRPTVLLGQNSTNHSKANSPFGPNPHYVVASGFDRSGHVIVNDPELHRPVKYNKNILNSAKLGIGVGGATGMDDNMSTSSDVPDPTAKPNSGVIDMGNKNTNMDDNMTTTSEVAKTNGDYIGKYVKQFESGDKGPFAISSGHGDHGGVSFGTYQFASSSAAGGNLGRFWDKYYKKDYPNVIVGANDEFKQAWTGAVQKNPDQFAANEHAFMVENYYTPFKRSAASFFDPDTYDRAAQEASWSSAIQYGPESAAKLIRTALNGEDYKKLQPRDFIEKLQEYKANSVSSWYRSSSKAVQDGVAKRHREGEKQVLLSIAGQEPIPVNSPPTADGSAGTTSTSSQSSQQSSTGVSGLLDQIFGNIFKAGFKKMFGGDESKSGALLSFFGFGEDSNQTNSTGASQGYTSTTQSGSADTADMVNNFPYFSQSDPQWGSKPFTAYNDPTQTMANSACGPTSMAMVLKSFGKNVIPPDTAEWALKNGFRTRNSGTSWDYFPAIATSYGLNGVNLGVNTSAVASALQSGKPVIATMRPDVFTKSGHYIVLSGVDKATGNILVNDPAGTTGRERSVGKAYPLSLFGQQGKNFWAFDDNGRGSIGQIGDPNRTANSSAAGIPPTDVDTGDQGSKTQPSAPASAWDTARGSGIPLARDVLNYTGGGSSLNTVQKATVSKISRTLRNQIGAGTSQEQLLQVIIKAVELLQSISNNTSKINTIINVLTNYFNSKTGGTLADTTSNTDASASMVKKNQTANTVVNDSTPSQQQELQELMQMLKTIAA